MKKIKVVSKAHGTHYILIDNDDYDAINKYKWSITKPRNTYYAVREFNKKSTLLHRFLLNVKKRNKHVDHINGNGLDNRKENLRICTCKENNRNSKLSKNNTSGYKGVSWAKNMNKWESYITADRKRYGLGYFKCKHDAAMAYNTAALKYHKDYASLNEIREET